MFSLNNVLKNILILLSLIVVLVMPVDAYASFSDNFEDLTFNKWLSPTSAWVISASGSNHFANSAGGVYIDRLYKPLGFSPNHWEFDMKAGGTTVFSYRNDSSTGCRVMVTSGQVRVEGNGNCGGMNFFNYSLPDSNSSWYRYILDDLGTTVRLRVYYLSNLTMYNESYITDVSTSSVYTSINMYGSGGSNSYFDNVSVSTEAVDAVTTGTLSFSSGSYVSGEMITLTSVLVNPDFIENKYYVVVSRSDGTIYNQYNIYDTTYSENFILEPAILLTATLYELNLAAGIYADEVILASAEIIPLGYSGEPLLSGNDISWWSSTYTLGSSGNISYSYESDEFGFLENPYIRISKNGVVLREYPTDFGVVSRSGGKLSYHFPEVGEYTTSLGKKSFLGSFQELKTSTTIVSISTGMLGVASSVPTNNPFNVTYTSSLGTSSSQDRVIKLYYYNSGSLELLTEYFFSGLNPSGTTQFKVTKPGNYYMKLLDLASGEMVLDAVDFSAYASTSLPTGNYTTSNISLIKSTWAADEILSGDYYIQSDYYRNSTIYFNFTGTSSKCIPLSDHGRFNCLVYLPAGSNVIHMVAQNGSTLTELANYTFTVSLLTTTGYRLSVFPDRLNIGEQYTVSIISPSNSVLNVTYNGVNGEALNELLSSSPINGSMSFTKTASKRGYYTFELLDDNSNVVMIQSLTVIDPTVSENGTGRNVEYPPIPSGRDAGAGIIDTLLGFMTLPIFWGVLFMAGCLYYLRNSSGLILPVLFIVINIEAVVGLLDPYGTYIVIVTWLVMAIFFIFVQRKTTG